MRVTFQAVPQDQIKNDQVCGVCRETSSENSKLWLAHPNEKNPENHFCHIHEICLRKLVMHGLNRCINCNATFDHTLHSSLTERVATFIYKNRQLTGFCVGIALSLPCVIATLLSLQPIILFPKNPSECITAALMLGLTGGLGTVVGNIMGEQTTKFNVSEIATRLRLNPLSQSILIGTICSTALLASNGLSASIREGLEPRDASILLGVISITLGATSAFINIKAIETVFSLYMNRLNI